jgi:PKD repeat protein
MTAADSKEKAIRACETLAGSTNGWRFSTKSNFVLLIVASILASMVLVATPVKADWIPYATIYASPNEVFPGETITFMYNLSVESIPGSFGVQINSVKVQFVWDSQSIEICPVQVNMTSLPAYHIFQRMVTVPHSLDNGPHVATITIEGKAAGDWWSTSKTWSHDYVASPQLQVGITGTPSNGIAPLSVSFSSMVAGGTSPYNYSWSFGDGGSSGLQEPSHIYSSPGTYNAKLTVSDDYYRSVNDTFTITAYPPLAMSIEANRTSGSVPLAVSFTSDVNGGSGGYTFSWDFGDGGTGMLSNPTHTFTSRGTFTVTLVVHDSKMNTESASTVVRATNLQVTISGNPTSGVAPLSVGFISTVSGGSGGYTYQWTFGDGSTSSLPNPTHVYTVQGSYTAFLTVTDSSSSTANSNSIHITVSTGGGNNGGDGGSTSGSDNTAILAVVSVLLLGLIGAAIFVYMRKKK